MAVFQVNGGIINSQTLTGSLRFFKMEGMGIEFAWTISDGTVNLPVSTSGGVSMSAPIVSSTIHPTNQFVAGPGNFTAILLSGTKISVTGTAGAVNNGTYTVLSSAYSAPNTVVTTVENVPATLGAGGILTGLFTTYFEVGVDRPVPNSAADLALKVISKQADITMIGMDDTYDLTTIIYFALSATALGWGSDTPSYTTPPADQPEDLTAAATQMQAAVQALGIVTVYVTAGSTPPLNSQVPVTALVDLSTVTITEVPFRLV